MAFVPLVFDEKGILYTTTRFLDLPPEEQDAIENLYITDLITFQEITEMPDAKSEYAQVSVNESGNPFRVFDPYLEEQVL